MIWFVEVSGGQTYGPHKIWNHGSTGSVHAVTPHGGLVVHTVEFKVLEADPTRRIVLFVPESYMPPFTWSKSMIQNSTAVAQQKFSVSASVGSFLNSETYTMNALFVKRARTVKEKSGYTHAVLEDFLSLSETGVSDCSLIRSSGAYSAQSEFEGNLPKKTTRAVLARVLAHDEDQSESSTVQRSHSTAAGLLLDFFQAGLRLRSVPRLGTSNQIPFVKPLPKVCPPTFDTVARHYAPLKGTKDDAESKTYGRRATPPPASVEAVFPYKTRPNEDWTQRARLKDVKNEVEPSKDYEDFSAEFVAYILGDQKGIGFPVSLDEVVEAQTLPTQRLTNAQALPLLHLPEQGTDVMAFQKAESYGTVKPPRNISNLSKRHNLRLSQFARACKHDVLTQHAWFGVGVTPKDTADRLVDIGVRCLAAGYRLIETDYSKFDGRVSAFLKSVADDVMKGWAHPRVLAEVTLLLDEEDDASAKTRLGYRYQTGTSRLSGSAITSDHNTIINGFVMYAAFRVSGKNPEQAWSSLAADVLVHGDDGVSWGQGGFKESLTKVIDDLGLSASIVMTSPTKPLTYLGRVWPGIMYGDGTSLGDPVRVLSGIHLTAAPKETSWAQAAFNKASAWLVTDRFTPMVADWCRTVITTCEYYGLTTVVSSTREERYRTENGAFPQYDEALVFDTFLLLTGTGPEDVALGQSAYRAFVDRLRLGEFDRATTEASIETALSEFPNAPFQLRSVIASAGLYFIDGVSPLDGSLCEMHIPAAPSRPSARSVRFSDGDRHAAKEERHGKQGKSNKYPEPAPADAESTPRGQAQPERGCYRGPDAGTGRPPRHIRSDRRGQRGRGGRGFSLGTFAGQGRGTAHRVRRENDPRPAGSVVQPDAGNHTDQGRVASDIHAVRRASGHGVHDERSHSVARGDGRGQRTRGAPRTGEQETHHERPPRASRGPGSSSSN